MVWVTSLMHIGGDKDITVLGKPDMIGKNTTYLWRAPTGLDAKAIFASVQAAPFLRSRSKVDPVCANEARGCGTARLQPKPGRSVVPRHRHLYATQTLNQLPSLSSIRSDYSMRPDLRSADGKHDINADMDIFLSLPASFPDQHIPAACFNLG